MMSEITSNKSENPFSKWTQGTDIEVVGLTDAGVKLDLGDNINLTLEYDRDGDELRQRVFVEFNHLEYDKVHNIDWLEGHMRKRPEISNKIADKLGVGSDKIKKLMEDVETVWRRAEDDIKDLQYSEKCREIESYVDRVEGWSHNDGLNVRVILDVPEDSEYRLTGMRRFSVDFVNLSNPDILKEKFAEQFAHRFGLIGEEWKYISEVLDDHLEIVYDDLTPEAEVISECALRTLESQLPKEVSNALDQKNALGNWSFVYETSSESKFDEETIWIRSSTLQRAIKLGADRDGASEIQNVAPQLISMDAAWDGSQTKTIGGRKERCYPINPEAVGIDNEMIEKHANSEDPSSDGDTEFEEDEIDGTDVGIIEDYIRLNDPSIPAILSHFEIPPSERDTVVSFVDSLGGVQS